MRDDKGNKPKQLNICIVYLEFYPVASLHIALAKESYILEPEFKIYRTVHCLCSKQMYYDIVNDRMQGFRIPINDSVFHTDLTNSPDLC